MAHAAFDQPDVAERRGVVVVIGSSSQSPVSTARSGGPVEVLLVGHSLGGGVRVGVVKGGERLVSGDGRLR